VLFADADAYEIVEAGAAHDKPLKARVAGGKSRYYDDAEVGVSVTA
jgi:hypothetical protein